MTTLVVRPASLPLSGTHDLEGTAFGLVALGSNLLIAIGDTQPGQTYGPMFVTPTLFAPARTNPVGWPGRSHGGRGSLVFVDGHVETARSEAWVVATDTARRRWNADHEPHPGTWGRE